MGKKGGKGTEDVSSGALDDTLDAYFGRKSSANAESKKEAVKSGSANEKDLDDQLSKYMDKAGDTKGDKENSNSNEAETEAAPQENTREEGVAKKSDAKAAEETK